jgi:hypothetical protein
MGIIWQLLFFLVAPPLFLIWKIADFYIRALTFSIKATIALIAYPFKLIASLLGGSFHAFELFYYQGVYNASRPYSKTEEDEDEDSNALLSAIGSFVGYLTTWKFRYIGLLIFFIWFFNFPQMIATVFVDPSQMGIGWLIDIFPMIFILALPFVMTIVVSAISFEFLGDGDKFWKASDQAVHQAKKLGAAGAATAGAAGAAAASAGQAAKDAGQAGMEAKEIGETAVTTASHIDTAGEMMGGEAATAEAAAAEGAAAEGGLMGLVGGSGVAGALGTALPVAAVILAVWIVYTLIAGVISLVLVAMTWAWASQFIPLIAGFIMPILGLGEAYGQWFGQSAANVVGPQIGGMFQEEMRMISHMGAKMGCALKGPQCLRQWRMNNTVRPGSEERGETYELRIEQFGLAQEQVDVAYKEKKYDLPINFLVYNTRHGLKGITARDVSYRILVEDSSHQGDNAYCTTGWKSINTGTGDFILPGLGVSPTKSLEQINLGNCGLLQPSLGVNRVLTMELKYDYSSQATLYFDAMSRQYRREEGITPSFVKSETAKTPVQSYINIRAPVTYYEKEGGGREAVPFPARFGFQTPGFSVDYHVKPETIDIDDSVLTRDISDSCSGLEEVGDNSYEISDRAKERMSSRQWKEDDDGDIKTNAEGERVAKTWFHRQLNPAPLRCTFELTDEGKESINPTGEQLLMRIDANYTIKREQEYSSFSVVNTRCTRNDCPMLVTDAYNASKSNTLLYDTCSYSASVDARGGCSLLDSSGGDIDWNNPQVVEDVTIRKGETAYGWNNIEDDVDTTYIMSEPDQFLGIEKELVKKMEGGEKGITIISNNGREREREVRYTYCEENDETLEEFGEAYSSRRGGGMSVLYFRPETTSCTEQEGLLESVADFFTGNDDPSFSEYENYCDENTEGGATTLVVKDGSTLTCYYGAQEG